MSSWFYFLVRCLPVLMRRAPSNKVTTHTIERGLTLPGAAGAASRREKQAAVNA